jgi:SAM-dependent methyltransferase
MSSEPMQEPSCDFGKTAEDYARHRTGFPAWFFDRLAERGVSFGGRRALDLGTGTGLLAREMAARGAEASGLDVSVDMLAQARILERASSRPIAYIQAPAEATGLGGETFDIVTAATCWHWFDRPKVAREIMRLLAPGGFAVICSLDWLPLPGNVVSATEALVRRHNPAWTFHDGDGLKPLYVHDLRDAGFSPVECFAADCAIEYTHEAWRGRVRASAGVAASLAPQAVREFDAELAAMLRQDFPSDPLAIDHCVFAALGRKPVPAR